MEEAIEWAQYIEAVNRIETAKALSKNERKEDEQTNIPNDLLRR